MKICKGCFYFTNEYEFGQDKASCSKLYSLPDDPICGDYRAINTSDLGKTTLPASDVMGTRDKDEKPLNSDSEQKNNIFDLVKLIFTWEQDIHFATEKVKELIESMGYELPFRSSKIEEISDNIIELYLTYQIACSFGMAAYADLIVKTQIDKIFVSPIENAKLDIERIKARNQKKEVSND